MLPAIKPFRSGRSTCPPDRYVLTVQPRTAKLSKFDAAAHQAIATAPRSASGNVFDSIADHLLTFDGEGMASHVTVACSNWLDNAEKTLQSDDAINDAVAVATMLSLDQILALAVKQNPSLGRCAWRVRKNLHASVFVSPSDAAEQPSRLIVGSRSSQLAEEEALDDYRGRRSFLSACKSLLDENKKQHRQVQLFQHAHSRHRSAVTMLCRGLRLNALTKSFYAWKGQAAADRELRRREADWAVEVEKLRCAQQKLLGDFVRTEKALHQCEMKLEYSEHAQKQLSTIDHAHERKLSVLKDEASGLKLQLAAAEKRYVDATSAKSAAIASVEANWRKVLLSTRTVSDNAYENTLRAMFDPRAFTTYADLLPWAKQLIALRGVRWGTYADKLPSSPLAYLVMMHVMSPGHLPSTALSRAVAGSVSSHNDALAHYTSALKLRLNFDVRRVAESSRDQDRLLFALFERFCGLAADVALKGPDFVDDVNYWALELNMPPTLSDSLHDDEDLPVEVCAASRAHDMEANGRWLDACSTMTKSWAMYTVMREDVS